MAGASQTLIGFRDVWKTYGRGDTVVSPVLWIVVLACPILVVLVARGLYAVLPKAAPSGR